MNFGERLRVLREAKNLTQTQVAKMAGVSRRAYVGYEQQDKRPRKRDTYVRLAEVLDCDVNDLLLDDDNSRSKAADSSLSAVMALSAAGAAVGGGMLAAGASSMAVGLPIVGFAGGLATGIAKAMTSREAEAAPLSHARSKFEQYAKEYKRFSSMATGLIYAALAESGVQFTPAKAQEGVVGLGPEKTIAVECGEINAWWLCFAVTAPEAATEEELDLQAATLMSRFLCYASDPSRKVSIVVQDKQLYEALKRKGAHNSYRGNMSAILVDTESATIAKEVYIATYKEDYNDSELMHIVEEA